LLNHCAKNHSVSKLFEDAKLKKVVGFVFLRTQCTLQF